MFRDKTVIVVGAGASLDAGFPVGSKLRRDISDLTRFRFEHIGEVQGNRDFWYSLCRLDGLSQRRQQASIALAKISDGIGFVSSVDNFLELHSDDADIQTTAKAAIAWILLDRERKSNLYRDIHEREPLQAKSLDSTWYQVLAEILFERTGRGKIEVAFNAVTFIAFNYDRAIEWFVYQALQAVFALPPSEASALANQLQVLHPYGDLGPCPWLGGGNGVPFGASPSEFVHVAVPRIRTFTEQKKDTSLERIRVAVSEAERIVFLGFGFHPQNLEVLFSEPARRKQIIATGIGLSKADIEVIRRILTGGARWGATEPIFEESNCSTLLSRYRRTLAVN